MSLLNALAYQVTTGGVVVQGVSNRWTGIWNGTVERKMEWNGECTQLV